MKRLNLLASTLLVGMLVFFVTASTYAANSLVEPGQIDCTGEQAKSAVCTSRTTVDPISGNNGILIQAANIIAIMGGVAAVIIIIISGIKFMTSGGDSEKIKSARNTIINAIIGIIIILLSRAIILFVTART